MEGFGLRRWWVGLEDDVGIMRVESVSVRRDTDVARHQLGKYRPQSPSFTSRERPPAALHCSLSHLKGLTIQRQHQDAAWQNSEGVPLVARSVQSQSAEAPFQDTGAEKGLP